MVNIKPQAASTRDYPKVREGDEEEYYGVGPDGMPVTGRRRRSSSDIEAAIAAMDRQGVNRVTTTPSTKAGADEPPPTFDDKDWNLKTG